MSDPLLPVGLAWNDDLDFSLFQGGAKRVGVIGLVCHELLDPGDAADAVLCYDAIGGVARGQDEGPRPEILVDNRVYLAVSTALRDPDGLKPGPPFPPLAQRCALTWELSKATASGGSEGAATVSNIFCQMPRSLHRAKRL